MSVQTGIRYFDGREPSRQEVEFLLEGLEARGSDYANILISRCLGMGFRGFLVAPEERQNQPLTGPHGSALTFDGRLDGRASLCARLPGHLALLDDASLVLMAYELFGQSCFEFLKGEFAFVLWDQSQSALFLVRSLCGTRQLYYTSDDKRVMWSSELDDLVIKSGIDPVVNDSYAIGFVYYQPDVDESPFRNVAVVPPGTYIQLTCSGRVCLPAATWHPERLSTLQLGSDGLYEEAWLREVESAITDRLRVTGPVFCELSGGLDSSTLVLLADRILAKSGRNPANLTTVSCTFETSRECDESFFISLIEEARGRAGLHVLEESLHATMGLRDIEFTGLPNTQHLFPGRYSTTERLMKRVGARVLLTGNGGDELFWSDPAGSPQLADLCVQGRVWTALSAAYAWSQSAEVPFWHLFLTQAMAPITARLRLVPWRPTDGMLTSWITSKAKHWLTQPGRRLGLRVDTQTRPPSRGIRLLSIRSLSALLSAGYYHEYHGIYFSHPFSHQGLIDFILSLPMNQLTRPGESRSLMRRATRSLLPEKIRMRRSKATLDEPVCRTLARSKNTLGDPENMEVCQREYAEPRALARAFAAASLGNVEQVSGLLRLLSLERWLRSLKQIETRRLNLKLHGTQEVPSTIGFVNSPEWSIRLSDSGNV
jgi:asparagine synthase (glutamine-hydrolysing)